MCPPRPSSVVSLCNAGTFPLLLQDPTSYSFFLICIQESSLFVVNSSVGFDRFVGLRSTTSVPNRMAVGWEGSTPFR